MHKRFLFWQLSVVLIIHGFHQIAFTQQGKAVRTQASLFQNVRIQNCTAINTDALEFSPAYYGNGLVFVSSRLKQGPVDEKLGETFFELFYADTDPNGMPGKPRSFSPEINTPLHEGPVSYSDKLKKIFFTRNNALNGVTKADKKKKIRMKIYEATKGDYVWEGINELSFNSDNYSCMHPAVSVDGKLLFFSSDRPGGYGGMDLYVSENRNGIWSKPINLGPDVNTGDNEVFPFMHQSGVLFFASDGHKGLGGLDLFLIDMSQKKWGQVVNLGPPFCSQADDLGVVLNAAGTKGYFTSSREGGRGKDDIYLFDAPLGLDAIDIPLQETLTLVVYDGQNSHKMSGAAVRLFERQNGSLVDNAALYEMELIPSSKASAGYLVKMTRKKESALTPPDASTDRLGEALLQLPKNKEFVLLVSKDGYTAYEGIYSTGETDTKKTLEISLQPTNCLALEGIALDGAQGKPIPHVLVRVLNQCTGVEDVFWGSITGKFDYCLEIGCDYIITTEKEGFSASSTNISTVKLRGRHLAEIELTMAPSFGAHSNLSLREGSVIVLENIYYDFGKSAIRTGDDRELEAIAQLMKQYPTMEIELNSYTDSRGEENYNLNLSMERSESARDFLAGRGIAIDRIKAFGFGETKIRNRCFEGVHCSEEEHQYNRRTEVRITKLAEKITPVLQEP